MHLIVTQHMPKASEYRQRSLKSIQSAQDIFTSEKYIEERAKAKVPWSWSTERHKNVPCDVTGWTNKQAHALLRSDEEGRRIFFYRWGPLHRWQNFSLVLKVEYARGVLRKLDGDPNENRELALFSLESAIGDYEVRTFGAINILFEGINLRTRTMLEFCTLDEFITPRRTFPLFPTEAFRDPTHLDTVVKAAVPKTYPVLSHTSSCAQ